MEEEGAASFAAQRLEGLEEFTKDVPSKEKPNEELFHTLRAYEPTKAYESDPGVRQFAPTEQSAVRPLPEIVRSDMERAVHTVEFGVWPEIRRAWAVMDTRLVIWDYMTESDEVVLPADASPKAGATTDFTLDRTICCVGLVPPRPAAFDDGLVKVRLFRSAGATNLPRACATGTCAGSARPCLALLPSACPLRRPCARCGHAKLAWLIGSLPGRPLSGVQPRRALLAAPRFRIVTFA